MKKNKTFRLVLIKPSHYDDDGYVIRWWRGGLPSNSLACLYGIALDCRERGVLGPDFNIEIDAIDETNWKVRVADLARAIKAADAGMVMLVGVQSNQFPRSLDLARQFRKLGIDVAIGGFHVSGTLSMLPKRDPGVQEMMDLGVSVFAGYIVGFPNDTPESIVRDIEIIKHELPIDMLEFFFLTPLPGSEDHKTLYLKGVAMDADLNKYDLDHVTTDHPAMSRADWERAVELAWNTYYSWEHIETLMRRAAATGNNVGKIGTYALYFKGYHPIERVHPLEGGVLRLKSRDERRPHLPVEPAWSFYPRYAADTAVKAVQWASLALRLHRLARKVKSDPNRLAYVDAAITLQADETANLDLYKTRSSQAFLDQRRHIEEAQNAKLVGG